MQRRRIMCLVAVGAAGALALAACSSSSSTGGGGGGGGGAATGFNVGSTSVVNPSSHKGGTLAFAVCSGTPEEGPKIAAAFEARHPHAQRLVAEVPGVSVSCDADGVYRIGPWLGREGSCPDVYQVVRWKLVDSP